MGCVIAAIDFSNVTGEVVEAAVGLSRALGGCLRILHAEDLRGVNYDASPEFIRTPRAKEIRRDMERIREIQKELAREGIDAQCRVLNGGTVEKIIEQARRFEADFIVIGTHEHSRFYNLFFGNTRDDLIRHAPCPVVVVPHQKQKSMKEMSLAKGFQQRLLGEILLEKKYVSPGNLEEALTIRKRPGERRLLGQILMDLGYVSDAQIEDCLATQAEEQTAAGA